MTLWCLIKLAQLYKISLCNIMSIQPFLWNINNIAPSVVNIYLGIRLGKYSYLGCNIYRYSMRRVENLLEMCSVCTNDERASPANCHNLVRLFSFNLIPSGFIFISQAKSYHKASKFTVTVSPFFSFSSLANAHARGCK